MKRVKDGEERLIRNHGLRKEIDEAERTLAAKRKTVKEFDQKMKELQQQREEMEKRLIDLKHAIIPSPPSPMTQRRHTVAQSPAEDDGQWQDFMEGGEWSP